MKKIILRLAQYKFLAISFLLLAVSFASGQDTSTVRQSSFQAPLTTGVKNDTTVINMKINNLQSQYQKISANVEEEKKLLLRIEGYVQALADQKNEMVEAEKKRIAALNEEKKEGGKK